METWDLLFLQILEKILRYGTAVLLFLIVVFTPVQLGSQSSTAINISDVMPHPETSSGKEFYRAVWRGAQENYLPSVLDQIANPIYQQWSTMDDIYYGLAFLQNITGLNPDRNSLFTGFLGNATKEKFVQIVFAERSNTTDLWWGNLDKTVEAATILQEIGAMGLTLAQLDEQLNYTLQLAGYYSTLAPLNITMNNVTCHISIESLVDLLKTEGTILNDVYFAILDILSVNNVSISDSTFLQSMNFLFTNVFIPIPIIFSEFSLTREDFDFLSQFKF